MPIRSLVPHAGPSAHLSSDPPHPRAAVSAQPHALPAVSTRTSGAPGPTLRNALPPAETSVDQLPPDLLTQVLGLTIPKHSDEAAARHLAQLSTVRTEWKKSAQDVQQDHLPWVVAATAPKIAHTAQRLLRDMETRHQDPDVAKLRAHAQLSAAIGDMPHLSIDFHRIPTEMSGLLVKVLAEHPQLQHLEISVPADFHAMDELMAMLADRPKVLQSLHVQGLRYAEGQMDMDLLARALHAQPGLTALNLSAIPISLATTMVEALSSLTHLHRLDLSDNEIGFGNMQDLSRALPSMKALKHLNLSHHFLDAEDAASLADALSSDTRLHLNLAKTSMSNAEMSALAEVLPRLKTLRVLNVAGNYIRSTGFSALARALHTMPHLEVLNLGQNQWDRASITALAHALPHLQHLQELNLNNVFLDGPGLCLLVQPLQGLSQLRHLDLGNNNPGDEIKVLGQVLPQLPKLSNLTLEGNRLTGAHMELLADGLKP